MVSADRSIDSFDFQNDNLKCAPKPRKRYSTVNVFKMLMCFLKNCLTNCLVMISMIFAILFAKPLQFCSTGRHEVM